VESDDAEVWLTVDCDQRYEVSGLGRVRSVGRLTRKRVLNPSPDSRGYYTAHIWENGRRRRIGYHVLVMRAFVGPRPEGFHINYKDGDKLNNRLDNLEYTSPAENTRHAHAIGLCPPVIGDRHHATRLSDDDVRRIRELRAQGHKLLDIAIEFGVCFQHVSDICRLKERLYVEAA
jgi:hypothetical protein